VFEQFYAHDKSVKHTGLVWLVNGEISLYHNAKRLLLCSIPKLNYLLPDFVSFPHLQRRRSKYQTHSRMTHHPSVEELARSIQGMVAPCFHRDPHPRVHCNRACGMDELVRTSASVCEANRRKHQKYRNKDAGMTGGGCASANNRYSEFNEETASRDPQAIKDCYATTLSQAMVSYVIHQQ